MFLYDVSIRLFGLAIRISSWFHPKASAFVTGRKDIFKHLQARFAGNTSKVVWVHCASLGEFEQGRPIIERITAEYSGCKILLTFFSPSGYEIRKNYEKAYAVFYLPIDTASNAERFVALTRPSLAIFVKYEFWYHYSSELKKQNVPLISVSSIFRKDQIFFKSMGASYRRALLNFKHFFVQNKTSNDLLASIGINNSTIAGDTRFDRVNEIVQRSEEIEIAKRFKGTSAVLVVGSSWKEDHEVLVPFINEQKMKFIIAPHEVSPSVISELEQSLKVKSVRYSHTNEASSLEEASVLIIDNIGMLSRLYRYGEFAYVGGAFGRGLHNILEAACYGLPIFFGNKRHQKFQEAQDLLNRGGAFEVRDYQDFKTKFESVSVAQNYMLACQVTRSYVEENLGATEKIMEYCRPILQEG